MIYGGAHYYFDFFLGSPCFQQPCFKLEVRLRHRSFARATPQRFPCLLCGRAGKLSLARSPFEQQTETSRQSRSLCRKPASLVHNSKAAAVCLLATRLKLPRRLCSSATTHWAFHVDRGSLLMSRICQGCCQACIAQFHPARNVPRPLLCCGEKRKKQVRFPQLKHTIGSRGTAVLFIMHTAFDHTTLAYPPITGSPISPLPGLLDFGIGIKLLFLTS